MSRNGDGGRRRARRVHVVGPVCFDLVFSGLPVPPRPGTEVRAAYLGISPGGVANIAVALARLGLDVALSAVFAEDTFGQYLWGSLLDEGIDLTYSVRSEAGPRRSRPRSPSPASASS